MLGRQPRFSSRQSLRSQTASLQKLLSRVVQLLEMNHDVLASCSTSATTSNTRLATQTLIPLQKGQSQQGCLQKKKERFRATTRHRLPRLISNSRNAKLIVLMHLSLTLRKSQIQDIRKVSRFSSENSINSNRNLKYKTDQQIEKFPEYLTGSRKRYSNI